MFLLGVMRRAHAAATPVAAPEFVIPESVAPMEVNPMAQEAAIVGDNPLAQGGSFGTNV